jgi:hypothetical protein
VVNNNSIAVASDPTKKKMPDPQHWREKLDCITGELFDGIAGEP